MAYDQMEAPPGKSGMGGMGESPPEAGPREDTFFLPQDFPGSEACKSGDTITLKVVGKAEDGSVEVEHVPGAGASESPDDWKTDLKSSMTMGEKEGM